MGTARRFSSKHACCNTELEAPKNQAHGMHNFAPVSTMAAKVLSPAGLIAGSALTGEGFDSF